MMNTTIEINQSNFDSEVLKADQPVIVDFWASWCGPCKMLSPVLDGIAAENAGRLKVVKVNLDENPELAERFSVQAIPTLLYFENGELRDRTVGVVSKREVLRRIERFAPAV